MKIKPRLKYILTVFVALAFTAGLSLSVMFAGMESTPTLSRIGSRGYEVTLIQKKLTQLGFYPGKIDGIYGPRTAQAVRNFQKSRGLVVDGIAGPKTLQALGIPVSSSGSAKVPYNQNDYNLMARIISAEARGEPYIGQVAVGAVIVNRVKHPSFPNTLSGVIYQPGAFTSIIDGQFHVAVAESAYRAARDALNGMDPTGGAIYYYNPATATSKWIFSRPVLKRIGKHVFCK